MPFVENAGEIEMDMDSKAPRLLKEASMKPNATTSETKRKHSFLLGNEKSLRVSDVFSELEDEVWNISTFEPLQSRDEDAVISLKQWLAYKNECIVSSHPSARFVFLVFSFHILLFIGAGLWEW